MDDSYEKYLRARVAALQVEAASVQQALDMYLDFKAKAERGAIGLAGSNGQASLSPSQSPPKAPVNKTAFVMDFLKEAGDNGAEQDAIWKEIQQHGIEMSKDHLRSILWHGVKDGRIERVNAAGGQVYVRKEPVASTTGSTL